MKMKVIFEWKLHWSAKSAFLYLPNAIEKNINQMRPITPFFLFYFTFNTAPTKGNHRLMIIRDKRRKDGTKMLNCYFLLSSFIRCSFQRVLPSVHLGRIFYFQMRKTSFYIHSFSSSSSLWHSSSSSVGFDPSRLHRADGILLYASTSFAE